MQKGPSECTYLRLCSFIIVFGLDHLPLQLFKIQDAKAPTCNFETNPLLISNLFHNQFQNLSCRGIVRLLHFGWCLPCSREAHHLSFGAEKDGLHLQWARARPTLPATESAYHLSWWLGTAEERNKEIKLSVPISTVLSMLCSFVQRSGFPAVFLTSKIFWSISWLVDTSMRQSYISSILHQLLDIQFLENKTDATEKIAAQRIANRVFQNVLEVTAKSTNTPGTTPCTPY